MSKWLNGRDPLTGRKVGLDYSLGAINRRQQQLLRPQVLTSTQAIAFIKTHNVHCLSREPTLKSMQRRFRELALLVHPDKNLNRPEAETAFKILLQAKARCQHI